MEVCELLTVELRLDRIEAELAGELPPHLRDFAAAHARNARPPPAPDVLHRATTLATARAALAHPILADRGLALLRLAAPVSLESDPAVATARAAEPTWAGLAALAAARDAAALARFGRRAIDVLHRLHGSAAAARAIDDNGAAALAHLAAAGDPRAAGSPADRPSRLADRVAPAELPPRIDGWFAGDGIAVDDRAVEAAWEATRARHGVAGAVRFERAPEVRPRAFVVEPEREVIVVIPARILTPAERFAVLHELGHAVAALGLPAGIPRVIDEAVAAYLAAAIECAAEPWHSPLAVAARARRRALASALDRIERVLPELPEPPRISERPPWALWHDPGAQAAYVAAESIAHAIAQAVGASAAPGALCSALAAWRAPIDRLGSGVDAP